MKLGESQQAFANRLGIALQTVARWETTGTISGKALLQLAELATESDCIESYIVFLDKWFSEIRKPGGDIPAIEEALRDYFADLLQGLIQALGSSTELQIRDPEAADRILVAICKAIPSGQLRAIRQMLDAVEVIGKSADLVASPTNRPIERLEHVRSLLRSAWMTLSLIAGTLPEKANEHEGLNKQVPAKKRKD